MADKAIVDKAISDLTQALQITGEDLFVLEQSGEAKKLKGATLLDFVTLSVVSVTVTTLPAGSSATATYDKSTGTLALGIPQGSKGDTGATGATGPANVLTIGSVTSGKVASATITGEAPNQVLNLVLEKGDKGDTGEKGATGARGPQGDKGAAGKDGTTPYIGSNGNWYIGDTDTGVSAGGASHIFKVIVGEGPGGPDTLSANKTFAEIKSAYSSGSMVVVQRESALYELTYMSNSRAEFTRVDATYYDVLSCINFGTPSESDIWQLNRTKRVNYDTTYRDIGLKTVPVAIKELQDKSAPAVTDADTGKYLHVNASTKELEWAEVESGGGNDRSLGITGAQVGQIAKITAVDTNGKPTKWEPVDMPGAEEWELIEVIPLTAGVALYDIVDFSVYRKIAISIVKPITKDGSGTVLLHIYKKSNPNFSITTYTIDSSLFKGAYGYVELVKDEPFLRYIQLYRNNLGTPGTGGIGIPKDNLDLTDLGAVKITLPESYSQNFDGTGTMTIRGMR